MSRRRPPWLCLLWTSLVAGCPDEGSVADGGGSAGASATSSTGPAPPTTTDGPAETAPNPESTSGISGTSTPTSTFTGEQATSTGAADTGGEAWSSSGGLPLGPCGNAQIDHGEDCDDGHGNNSNTGACTEECKTNICGDGKIWDGHEECDYHYGNNNMTYGGCTTECKWGPRCGDNEIQGPEECDNGAANGTSKVEPPNSVPCDAVCHYNARIVFLSSSLYRGGDLGGVEGAHLKCQNLAKWAGLDNSVNFKAWLSDGQHSPAKDFAHDPPLPYVMRNGVLVAADWKDLTLNGPSAGIICTEQKKGDAYVTIPDVGVWTGTTASGNVLDAQNHCESWTNSTFNAGSRRGLSGGVEQEGVVFETWRAERQWTSLKTAECDYEYRIYCFEQ